MTGLAGKLAGLAAAIAALIAALLVASAVHLLPQLRNPFAETARDRSGRLGRCQVQGSGPAVLVVEQCVPAAQVGERSDPPRSGRPCGAA